MNHNQEPKFSLITIVNKEPLYQEFKRNLAEQQGVSYELIKVNNDHNQYQSARLAFNEAAQQARGEYLVFLHPDMRFLDPDALRDILAEITSLDNLGVAGIAGSPLALNQHKRSYIVTSMVQGTHRESVGELIDSPVAVQTVDESFFVMTAAFFRQHPFTTMTGWHFYSVEECLVALLNGYTNYVVPSRAWHQSPGSSENLQYVQMGYQIVKKYGQSFPWINTTVEQWPTHGAARLWVPWINYWQHRVMRKIKAHPQVYQFGRQIKHQFQGKQR